MRIVILASSVYSETACAVAAKLAAAGHVPMGALALAASDRATLRRKLAQLGPREVLRYARAKLAPKRSNDPAQLQNSFFQPLLKHDGGFFRSLRQVAAIHRFPVVTCKDHNAPGAVARVRDWSPDLILFTGGNILRKQMLEVPRLGVLNLHLGLLPEVRGMSSPEWSLLENIPPGVTIHYLDAGIDTGPVLKRCEFPGASRCSSLSTLRNQLIAFGVDRLAEVVDALDKGAISATPQPDHDLNQQYFVMHDWLRACAAERLAPSRLSGATEAVVAEVAHD